VEELDFEKPLKSCIKMLFEAGKSMELFVFWQSFMTQIGNFIISDLTLVKKTNSCIPKILSCKIAKS
jgi:hypothetical protein